MHSNRYLLEDMGSDLFAADSVFGNTFLVDAHKVKNLQGTLVNFIATIADNADDDLLPAIVAPCFRPGP